MSVLANLLQEPPGAIDRFIRHAEQLCGYPSEDSRLLAEISAKLPAKIAKLGLDPLDTTAEELYHALRSKATSDSQQFNRLYGFSNDQNNAKRLGQMFEHKYGGIKTFSLKQSVARQLLLAAPPKQLMKKLNYRTVDSMLKREDTGALYSLVFDFESSLWRRKFNKALKQLSASDFQERDIKLIEMSPKLAVISTNSISPSLAMGCVVLNPAAKFQISGLYAWTMVESAAEQVLDWGFAAGQRQLNKDFAKFISQSIDKLPHHIAVIGDMPISHGHLRRSLRLIENYAPFHPALNFWHDSDYMAKLSDDKPISMNLSDLLNDSLHGSNYSERRVDKLKESVWHKLLQKYLKYPAFETKTLQQLNPEPILLNDEDLSQQLSQDLAAVGR